jgi:amino acid transporter
LDHRSVIHSQLHNQFFLIFCWFLLCRYIKKYARIYNDIPYYVITTELVHTALLIQFIVDYVKHYK